VGRSPLEIHGASAIHQLWNSVIGKDLSGTSENVSEQARGQGARRAATETHQLDRRGSEPRATGHQAAQALLQRFIRLTGCFPLTSVGLLAATLAFSTMASEIKQADINFTGRTYQYHFIIELQAPLEVVRDIVTDYDNLARINDDIVQSEILEHYNDRQLKRRMWLNHCVLVFCFDLYFVENVEELDDGTITTTVIAAESNFRRGYSKWRIESVSANVTRISVEAEQEPDFWIPPIIGPMIFKRAFMKEVRETAIKIELEAKRAKVE
jgi:hypothetical protein